MATYNKVGMDLELSSNIVVGLHHNHEKESKAWGAMEHKVDV